MLKGTPRPRSQLRWYIWQESSPSATKNCGRKGVSKVNRGALDHYEQVKGWQSRCHQYPLGSRAGHPMAGKGFCSACRDS